MNEYSGYSIPTPLRLLLAGGFLAIVWVVLGFSSTASANDEPTGGSSLLGSLGSSLTAATAPVDAALTGVGGIASSVVETVAPAPAPAATPPAAPAAPAPIAAPSPAAPLASVVTAVTDTVSATLSTGVVSGTLNPVVDVVDDVLTTTPVVSSLVTPILGSNPVGTITAPVTGGVDELLGTVGALPGSLTPSVLTPIAISPDALTPAPFAPTPHTPIALVAAEAAPGAGFAAHAIIARGVNSMPSSAPAAASAVSHAAALTHSDAPDSPGAPAPVGAPESLPAQAGSSGAPFGAAGLDAGIITSPTLTVSSGSSSDDDTVPASLAADPGSSPD